jgi:sugar lactone lactonase YvrE
MSSAPGEPHAIAMGVLVLGTMAAWAAPGGGAAGQPANDAPNPYHTVEHVFKMPAGRTWGATSAVEIDPDGTSIWVAERCGANSCSTSDLPAILKFDASGTMVKSFGAGLFVFPHGIHVDRGGNIWVTDGQGNQVLPRGAAPDTPLPKPPKGHQVFKFSPDGKVLLTLGKAGVAGSGRDTFNAPSDVVTGTDGAIFVADGHGGSTNARIVKFAPDGTYIKEWGRKGSAPGEFDTPHGLAIDSRGRLFVADRGNNRLQIFDQDGKFLEEWRQFSRLSGIYIDRNDVLYGTDSESNEKTNPGWKRGIRIGSARDGKVTAFIPDPEPDPDKVVTSGGEGVAADAKGNVYGAEVGPRALKKYVRK